jgi:flagellar hook-basal body complex protein FliE
MVNFNPNLGIPQNSLDILSNSSAKLPGNLNQTGAAESGSSQKTSNFSDALEAIDSYISDVNGLQQASDTSIKDLLSSSNADITSVVSAVAEADVNFKLLVGVRNKLIEAYKQTMNMQL